MIDFPVTLHEIEKFQVDDRNYVVDLDRNELVCVDLVVWNVLELCDSRSRKEIISHLKAQHTEAEIFEAFECLKYFSESNLLVSNIARRVPDEDQKSRLVTFLNQGPASQSKDGSTYLLLESLSQNMEVTVGIPKDQWDESYRDDEVFHFMAIETDLKRARTYYINATYDVTIAFVPVDFGVLSIEANEVIPFFSWNNVPTIVRANSGVRDEDAFINFVLAVYGAKRPFDAIVVDAPWVIHRFQEILSSDIDFRVIPDPVDLERFQAYQEKTIGKRCISAIFDTQEVFQKPVVGIIAGEAFEVNYRVGKFIAQLCPELFFVVFAPKLPDVYVNNLPSNLVFYTETEQFGTDPHLLPMLFNAMDICFFHASLQSSSSLLSQSLACGVPTLIGTSAAIPEFGNACAFIDSKRGITDSEYLKHVLENLNQLLADPSEMDRLSKDGRKLAESFSADAISTQFANLVHSLTQQQLETQAMSTYSSLPNLFCYHYDSNHGSVRSQALQHPHHSAESIEVGLAKELLNS
ncbi:glycosyltransferase, partial [Candidatus Poribacteria bacterium]|nr:glycosyltransferase [Candidatus Poribacteria bacterium]